MFASASRASLTTESPSVEPVGIRRRASPCPNISFSGSTVLFMRCASKTNVGGSNQTRPKVLRVSERWGGSRTSFQVQRIGKDSAMRRIETMDHDAAKKPFVKSLGLTEIWCRNICTGPRSTVSLPRVPWKKVPFCRQSVELCTGSRTKSSISPIGRDGVEWEIMDW